MGGGGYINILRVEWEGNEGVATLVSFFRNFATTHTYFVLVSMLHL